MMSSPIVQMGTLRNREEQMGTLRNREAHSYQAREEWEPEFEPDVSDSKAYISCSCAHKG